MGLWLAGPFLLKADAAPRPELVEYDFTLSFAGDINLDDSQAVMQYFHAQGDDLEKVIDPAYIRLMQSADLMWINNEFTYSTRGSALPGKAYTFRADPENVELLKQMGVDLVGLANNHVYDYGKDALLDTLTTLEEAGIPYGGAGRDLEEASAPVYRKVGDKTIAYVAASRAEKNKMTPQATETSPGILRCYDNTLFLEKIREARENADFVIALVHWGTEYSTQLEEVQLTTGREYIDAGADAVIGAHSHCLQGMEYYKGKPIVYSLGNFWFNGKTLDTMVVSLRFYGYNHSAYTRLTVYPGVQSHCVTTLATDPEEKKRIWDLLEDISVNVYINSGGVVYPR
ncbi:MAG: CapA family protein [Lachnospiraceae bacterium]|nr:CapA family protein [Lachnospiraceae bacterium]